MARSLQASVPAKSRETRAIDRVISLANGKGGVGKTTTAANVGGYVALAGSRVLMVDLDPQGDLARDLGYERQSGRELFHALVAGTAPMILRDVRENLDVIPGGQDLEDIQGLMVSRSNRSDAGDFGDMLYTVLAPLADDYDLILIDTPPGERILVEGAFAISSAVVIPTRSDDASIDGVERIARRFMAVRDRNPNLQLAGIVLFGVGPRSLRLERSVRETLEEMLGTVAPVFETRIRNLESASADARRKGLLFHELEGAVTDAQKNRLKALRAGEKPADGFFSRNAGGLAEEYEQLTGEILARLNDIESGNQA
ncbi:Cobyrinic acid a,c-diamide synthase (plasmid) [Arthrobacter sp. FB24]|uniref:ParA family protein n=1 Tax=Arthrobacter sp. (strain FB24) TaxID=290399 RepID=UPI000052726B|nr:ParA family protein [Arthrobacter sp. FB24]ABK05688.1 Cobyrinic acid a,c-diamide synthase [Arthrobacter sp. FB24]